MGHKRTETETRAIRVFFFYHTVGVSRRRDGGAETWRGIARNGGGILLFGRRVPADRLVSRGKKACAYGGTGLFLYMDGRDAAFVVHGGTIMAVMSRIDGGDFYDYQIDNGECLVFNITA